VHEPFHRRAQRRLVSDRFFVDDGVGAQGEYQVLVRERGRRVMFSRGHHTGRVVGTITGIGLTELHFEARERRAEKEAIYPKLVGGFTGSSMATRLLE